uniref:Uncharacterized protein n=1 Tax=Coccolithus braarudii TaxID=221442 RepID=A0A7S0LL24_9EUKA|mmetsp:Transcript_41397/g.88296  ORF Transcript_41397/g.88296 Transcript_41397/m.88296 type:complete len:159 (+) Transcript_41397:175-651(+)|eukprot:CAMPEP_0183333076 /NCGR_PEP_ID=MMETSP0164_2-20130417/2063_1 /TAXON_ID=221442 /ORGANISM="Coccolithus pelagicus ssp braarudi, Strain PLY182g" /LENGTH=158 /DNA_ID=CAMNT_0025501905 /DNA_START=171 /DNA_END=647 /DNA_ORIENTATION=+
MRLRALLLFCGVAALNDADADLIEAAGEGSVEGVLQALAHGANVNTRSSTGAETPLHLSGIACSKPVIQALLAAGADVNAHTAAGDAMSMTPLHWFVNMNPCDEEAVSLLLDAGADLDLHNSEGQTPLDMVAKITTRAHIAELLRMHAREVKWLKGEL